MAIVLILAACTPVQNPPSDNRTFQVENVHSSSESIKELPDGTKYLVHPDDLLSGGPPKDGIPSIDEPKFISAEQADLWLSHEEKGAAVIHKGVKRFYPLQIMVWHEIVNEKISGDPILITYCPLCGSVIAFERKIGKEEVEFGTTGKLYNSNLVMYDRKTETYWTQIGGRAIIGELTGHELELFPVDTVTWQEWREEHPDSEVLSRNTGHFRSYGTEPYSGYYESESLYFPVGKNDKRLHPKAVVFGIVVNGSPKAYPEPVVKQRTIINDEIAGIPISIERTSAGMINITNQKTSERIPYERDFWFAWFAFHPDTSLYE